jgi:hypothetical protein
MKLYFIKSTKEYGSPQGMIVYAENVEKAREVAINYYYDESIYDREFENGDVEELFNNVTIKKLIYQNMKIKLFIYICRFR